jgi:DNA-binding LacI/PurR family transcriptional regulator
MTVRHPSVGMKDVALAAGVSLTTVSDALNNKGRLSTETRDRVLEIAARLEYRPFTPARTLATGRSALLAVTISEVKGLASGVTEIEYFMELMVGAIGSAFARGYTLIPTPVSSTAEVLDDPSLSGVIIVDPVSAAQINEFRESGVVVVTTGRVPGTAPAVPWVDNDHRSGAKAMLRHLERAGATRSALLTVPAVYSYSADAINAYEEWCVGANVAPVVTVAEGMLTEGGGYAAARELLEAPDRPDAIYATADTLALGALLAAKSLGIAIPDDLLIAGGTDSGAARTAKPSLTSLNLSPRRIGEAAASLLIELIEGRGSQESNLFVASRVVPRASTRRRRPRSAESEVPRA